MILDANTFGPDEAPPQLTEDAMGLGYTNNVLIDITSDRTDNSFHIGWFDHDTRLWEFRERSHKSLTIGKAKKLGLRWSFLPLAIYETNPELRKTVKI
jgi:hypothetical protein